MPFVVYGTAPVTAVTGAPGVYARRLRPGQAVLLGGTGKRAWTPSPAPATTVDTSPPAPATTVDTSPPATATTVDTSPTATATNRDPGRAPATNAAPARPRDHGRDHDRPATATATAATAAAASAAAAGGLPAITKLRRVFAHKPLDKQ